MRTDPEAARVTVETNLGGDLLLTTVREALAHLPVHVQAVTRTAPHRRSTA